MLVSAMDHDVELFRLLARLKLRVRRQLNESVDLDRLVDDKAYAEQRLADIEDSANDEDLLVLVMQIRRRLASLVHAPAAVAPAPVPAPAPVVKPAPVEPPPPPAKYAFGARS